MSAGTETRHESAGRILGLIRKETREIVRDPSSVLIAGVLPVILLFLFGYGITFDPRFFDVGLVTEQATPESGSFAAALENSPYFEVEIARDRRAFEDDLVSGRLDGIVVMPAQFTETAYRGETPAIQVLVDGSDPNTSIQVRNFVELLWANWLAQESIARGRVLLPAAVTPEPRIWFNAEVSSKNYLVPGTVAIILTLTGALLTALVIAREWERGTMEALLATPLGLVELLIGKLAPYFVLGMGSMVLSVLIAIFLFEVPYRGSIAPLVLVSAFFMWSALGQGLLISTLARNQLVAAQASIMSSLLPAFYFSNFVFELGSMPWPLQAISYAVPARYYVSSLQTLFLSGDIWSVLLPDLIGIIAISAVFFTLTAFTTKTRLD